MTTMTTTSLRLLAILAVLVFPGSAAAQDVAPPTPTAQAAAGRPPVERPSPALRGQTPRPAIAEAVTDQSAPQAFSVVLVLGDMQANSAADNVPAAARKALTDMKDFLPYKGYRLLDTQWTLCCGSAPLSGHLKGPDEQEYELMLQTTNIRNGEISVRFLLREAGSPAGALEAAAREAQMAGEINAKAGELAVQLTQLQRQQAEMAQRIREASPADRSIAQKEMLELERQMARTQNEIRQSQLARNHPDVGFGQRVGSTAGSSAVIDASFRMDVGETVVVGTSRTKGDKALIALLTAVPPKGTSVR